MQNAECRMQNGRHLFYSAFCILHSALLLAGCATIRVDRTHGSGLNAAWRASAVRRDELSPRTLQTLRQWDLADLYAHSPDEAETKLHDEAVRNPQPDLVFALAEINYLRGRKAEKHDCAHATAYYYLCAGYAYHYLFDEPPRPAPDMEHSLKSASLSAAPSPVAPPAAFVHLRSALPPGLRPVQRRPGQAASPPPSASASSIRGTNCVCPRRTARASRSRWLHTGFTWKPEEFGQLLVCSDYEAVGLANQHRTYGLGVPLIATRSRGRRRSGRGPHLLSASGELRGHRLFPFRRQPGRPRHAALRPARTVQSADHRRPSRRPARSCRWKPI